MCCAAVNIFWLIKDVEATEDDKKYGTFKRMQGFLSVSKAYTLNTLTPLPGRF